MAAMLTEMDDLRSQAMRIVTYRPTTPVGDLARIACMIERLQDADVDPVIMLAAVGCDMQICTLLAGRKWDLVKGEILALRMEWLAKHHPEAAAEAEKAHGVALAEQRKRAGRKYYRSKAGRGQRRRKKSVPE